MRPHTTDFIVIAHHGAPHDCAEVCIIARFAENYSLPAEPDQFSPAELVVYEHKLTLVCLLKPVLGLFGPGAVGGELQEYPPVVFGFWSPF